ncbi:hypothetical protein [Dickeya dadantii]|uniref:hypothetical protein n=1 Tax=Dickeya dadantii TaxID=204038 RepID=UPI00142D93B1|nr:hypothetical protein [Dickeya dadantii]
MRPREILAVSVGDAGLPDRVARHDVDSRRGFLSVHAGWEAAAPMASFGSGCISPRTVTTARPPGDGQFGDVRGGTHAIVSSLY